MPAWHSKQQAPLAIESVYRYVLAFEGISRRLIMRFTRPEGGGVGL